MTLWWHVLGLCGMAVAFWLIARWLARSPVWWLVYAISLLGVVSLAISHRRPDLSIQWQLDRLTTSEYRWLGLTAITSLLLGVLVANLPKPGDRRALTWLAVCLIGTQVLWPTVAEARARIFFESGDSDTPIGRDGVYRQSTDYSCGPAAAVTALRRLGLPASEAELALLARTSSATGTPPDVLVRVLNARYANEGLTATVLRLKTLDELETVLPCLVTVQYGLWVDHWLYVVSVSDTEVEVADPSLGWVTLKTSDFLRRWRRNAVVLKKEIRVPETEAHRDGGSPVSSIGGL